MFTKKRESPAEKNPSQWATFALSMEDLLLVRQKGFQIAQSERLRSFRLKGKEGAVWSNKRYIDWCTLTDYHILRSKQTLCKNAPLRLVKFSR